MSFAHTGNKHLEEHYREKRWICSERSEVNKQGVDTDPAVGVAILLSSRMADRLLDQGNVGARIVYVRLQGPVCNLFVIVTYAMRLSSILCSLLFETHLLGVLMAYKCNTFGLMVS